LKKRTKKLLFLGSRGPIRIGSRTPTDKSLFASFSSEKEDSSLFYFRLNMQIIYSAHHNVSDRISPRFWRPEHCCPNTSSQTWLTAARPETYQNLIYSLNDRNARPPPRGGPRASNGNTKNPAFAGCDDAPNLCLARDVSIVALRHQLPKETGGG